MIDRRFVIAIHGAPRSGTSWLGQLFNSSPRVAYRYQPFFSYAFRDRVDTQSDTTALGRFFTDLLESTDPFVLQTGAARMSETTPVFRKDTVSHLVYKEVRFHHLLPHLLQALPRLKAIGIVRDPRNVLTSWVRAPREFDSNWSLATEWRSAPSKNAGLEENWYGFNRWRELTYLQLKLAEKYPDRFRLVRYERLCSDPYSVMDELYSFAALPMDPQTRQFIEASTSRDDHDPYGVFRSGGARNPKGLPAAIESRMIDELRGTALERFLVPA